MLIRRAIRTVVVLLLSLSAPAAAQTRVGTVQQSPFAPDTSRIYDNQGNLVGTARDNAFIPGRTDVYDSQGRSTGIEIQPNAFDPSRRDVLDERGDGADSR